MAAPTHSTGRNVIFWRKEIRQSSLLPSAWLVRESEKRGKPNLNILFQYNMPLRGLAQMTGGIIGEETVDGLVLEAKGFWVIGILRALVGLLQNHVANSRYQAKLDEQSR